MSEILMQLGSFQFSVALGAYQDLSHRLEIRTARLDRASASSVRQILGDDETLDISGVIYPRTAQDLGRIDALRELALSGEAQMLTDGRGRVWGKWVIEQVEERASLPLANGVPLKLEFRLALGAAGART